MIFLQTFVSSLITKSFRKCISIQNDQSFCSQETEIGKVVNGLKKSSDEKISSVARNVIQKWKDVVAEEEDDDDDDDEDVEEVEEDPTGLKYNK